MPEEKKQLEVKLVVDKKTLVDALLVVEPDGDASCGMARARLTTEDGCEVGCLERTEYSSDTGQPFVSLSFNSDITRHLNDLLPQPVEVLDSCIMEVVKVGA